jgi:23S rRNA (cytosine1962-C5)-methyltransferase
VRVSAGEFNGFGLWDAESDIAVRIFSRKRVPDQDWFDDRVRAAWALRGQLSERGVSAFRLLFGESDGVPGVTVDSYAGHCLLTTMSESLGNVSAMVARSVMKLAFCKSVLCRDSQAPQGLRVLAGKPPERRLVVEEYGVRLGVDLVRGQKTGLFLDHRDNRSFVREHAERARVLNLFCYTGAFSLAALRGGASHVTSVDSAKPALQAARENFELNGFDPEKHEFVYRDAFEWLAEARTKQASFDLVVSDPPSFARRREQLPAALKAYRRLSVAGLRVTREGGLYAAASCTSLLSPERFKQMLCEAAQRANVHFQVVHEAGQAVDHPVLVGHPEARYLKFVTGRVLSRF